MQSDINNFYGLHMTQTSPHAEIDFDGSTGLETIFATADDVEFGFLQN